MGMKKIPTEVLEASKLDGANGVEAFIKIKLPLIFPQVFRAFFMVFVYSFTSFGIVLGIGGLKYSTLEVEIVNALLGSGDFSKIIALGLLQFLILTGVNILGEKIPEYELKEEKKAGEVTLLVKIYSLIFVIFELGIVGVSIVFSFYNYYLGKFSMEPFLRILSSSFNEQYPVIRSIINSSILSGISGIVVVVFTYLILREKNKLTTYIIFSTFGISSGFLSIALIYTNIVYDIPYIILLVVGFFLVTVPIAYSFMYQYVKKFPRELLEASSIDGASRFQTFIYVELPILKEVLINTYLQIFAIIYAEFTIVYTMQLKEEFPLSSVLNYELYINKLFLESSAMNTLNILIIIGLFTFPYLWKGKEEEENNEKIL
jgi:thiamine transport system permease protein